MVGFCIDIIENVNTFQISYNNTSNVVFAASRDRALYGWMWPKEPSTQPLQPASPDSVLHGHSLGVTAMDTSNGKLF